MAEVQVGDFAVAVDMKGNLILVGQVTLLIEKLKARDIFSGKSSSNPNHGLFPIKQGSKTRCLSVMPDDVAKINLTEKQFSAIKMVLSIK